MNLFRRGCNHLVNAADGWRSMDSAPRDGTVVELMCTYGVAPWYGLHRWDAEWKTWRSATDDRKSVDGEATLHWRPTSQSPEAYTDPTNGAQDSREYWLAAVARVPSARTDEGEKR